MDEQIENGLYRRSNGSYFLRRNIQGTRRSVTLRGIATVEGARQCSVMCDMAVLDGEFETFVKRFAHKKCVTFKEAAAMWICYSAEVKRNKPKVLAAKSRTLASLKVCNMRALTLAHLEEWVSKRNAEVSETTVADDVTRVKSFVRWCYDKEYLSSDVGKHLRGPRPSKKTKDTAHLVMCVHRLRLEPLLHHMVHALHRTGLRLSELYRVSEIDIHESLLHVRCEKDDRTKDARGRSVPIDATTRGHLLVCARSRLPSANTLRKALVVQSKRLGVSPHITPHALRHTRASVWADEGYSLVQIQHWLGHADQRTTQLYVHPLPGRIRLVV